ncbi:protoporphyrinogen oxidase [Pontibacter roseus]|uniref:protoporphyrinogen oxidase n=1 Tax=Pontibacter roseus TaxID=336989 RepID=UPI00035CF3D4|nr:protoporphyrinogen oxidase [Pontibacter roseus]
MRVAIIGAGISGLALAYYLQKMGIAYDLFEAGQEVGGNLRTIRQKGYVMELGPTTLQMSEELLELITELKLESDLLPIAPRSSNRYVLHNGKHQKLPSCAKSFKSNNLFSWDTKYRILQERQVPPAQVENETITQFFERRFGPEVVDVAIAPLVSSLYAGDPDQLLVSKALPSLKEFETRYGSVLKGLMHRKNKGVFQKHFSFSNGLDTLPNAIARKLISMHLEHQVECITRSQGKFIISCSNNGDHDTEEYDKVVLALPAHQAADLLEFTFPGMAAALQNINYPPMAVVHSVYNRAEVGHSLKGFGTLNSRTEGTFTTGSIWTSSLFGGRCRTHEVMITSFVDGSRCAPDLLADEKQVLRQVHEELRATHNITALAPVFQHMHLWHHAMPQYDLYIEDAHQMASQLENEGLYISANWGTGVSVPSCVRQAKELANKINSEAPFTLNS